MKIKVTFEGKSEVEIIKQMIDYLTSKKILDKKDEIKGGTACENKK